MPHAQTRTKPIFTEYEESYIQSQVDKYIRQSQIDNEIKKRIIEGIREKRKQKETNN